MEEDAPTDATSEKYQHHIHGGTQHVDEPYFSEPTIFPTLSIPFELTEPEVCPMDSSGSSEQGDQPHNSANKKRTRGERKYRLVLAGTIKKKQPRAGGGVSSVRKAENRGSNTVETLPQGVHGDNLHDDPSLLPLPPDHVHAQLKWREGEILPAVALNPIKEPS